jgi:hypothetical protein
MKRIFRLALHAFAAAREEQARRAAFSRLDPHMLRDIGLEMEAEQARRRAQRDRRHFSRYY